MCRQQELRYVPGESDEKPLPSSFKICNNYRGKQEKVQKLIIIQVLYFYVQN